MRERERERERDLKQKCKGKTNLPIAIFKLVAIRETNRERV